MCVWSDKKTQTNKHFLGLLFRNTNATLWGDFPGQDKGRDKPLPLGIEGMSY